MRDIQTINPVQPVSPLRELAQLSVEVNESRDKTQEYISKLENYIIQLLTRTPEMVDAEVTRIINSLSAINDSYILNMKINSDYGAEFFKNEIDNAFKIALAQALLNLLKSRYNNNLKNSLLEGIATQDLSYIDFFNTPFVKS